MRWSPDELAKFFGSPVLQPDEPELPYTVRFADDLLWGELWVLPGRRCAVLIVRRPQSHEEVFEFSLPCWSITPGELSGGIPALFFYECEIAKAENCRLYITKSEAGRFAFYPALRWRPEEIKND